MAEAGRKAEVRSRNENAITGIRSFRNLASLVTGKKQLADFEIVII